TPDMLPVLKEAGVVDSGAMGFIVIAERMLQYLSGKVYSPQKPSDDGETAPDEAPDASLFHEHSPFPDGYCMEFILQLMAGDAYDQKFRLSRFIADLELYGDSIVAVQNEKRVKAHIHTHRPEKVMALSRTFGEFLTFKLDNMQVQHNRHDREIQQSKPEKRNMAIVAAVNGEGLKNLFLQLGCAAVIDGGETMNTSAQEFIDVFASLNADRIVVLPNNPNVVPAAKQAADLMGAENVTVLQTSGFAQGYFALAMDVPDSTDTAFRIRQMQKGAQSVVTLEEATASREFTFHGICCRQGDEILLIDHELACVSADRLSAVLDGLALVKDIDEKETCVLMRGADASQEEEDALVEAISGRYPLLDVQSVYGGQALYHWIVGLI
ncbi:MAG: hypothetical protein J6X30_02480, partial [Clostridia bacterium]|nr:hypothetical protein [Clostridia bacterium]